MPENISQQPKYSMEPDSLRAAHNLQTVTSLPVVEVKRQPLVASALARRVDDPGSPWFQEMIAQMDAFRATGNPNTLHIGEGYQASDYMASDSMTRSTAGTNGATVQPTGVEEGQTFAGIGESALAVSHLDTRRRKMAPQRVQALLARNRNQEKYLPEERESRADLEQYRPDASKFHNPKIANSIFHPVDHLARTLIWSGVIANQLPSQQKDTIDSRVLKVAAVLHDVGRGGFSLNKHVHGAIAADLLRDRKRLSELLPEAHTDQLTDGQVEDIAYLVENHHQFDHDRAHIRSDMRVALSVLQTADGLDLARGNFTFGGPFSAITDRTSVIDDKIPIVKHTLRLKSAVPLRALASKFASRTAKEIIGFKDRFTASLDVAQELRIIRA